MKFSLSEAAAYPIAVDNDPSIPLVPRLQQILNSGRNGIQLGIADHRTVRQMKRTGFRQAFINAPIADISE